MNTTANLQHILHSIQNVLRYTLEPGNVTFKIGQWQIPKMDGHRSYTDFPYDWSIVIATSFFLAFLFTYLITSLKSSIALGTKRFSRKPPIMPYWIPFFGNIIPFLWNPASFCSKAIEKYGYSIPIRLRLGPLKIYLVSGADHYETLFGSKASRCMNTKASVLLALRNLFGTPANVIPYYAGDNSGVNSTPLPGSRVKPEHRITYFQTRAAHKHLSGLGLVQMTDFFLKVLEREIDGTQVGSEWVDQPDLYRFLQNEVFRAAVEALCGPYLFSQSPTFVEDFWEFVSWVPTLIKGFPRWMLPKPYRVRGRLLDAIKRWHELAHKHSDCTKIGVDDPEWEPYFGSKLIRARQEYSRSMHFMDADALAAEDLGLIFATNTNAIPSITWFMFEICRDPELLSRVQKEVKACRISFPTDNKASFDIIKLCSQPLLQSIYAETLRLRVALFITRTPEYENFGLGEWELPPQTVIALSSRAGAMNPNVWNVGTPENPHPLHAFWADRFLIYANDPTSGPQRKEGSKSYHGGPVPAEKALEPDPRFSMDGVAGGWIPYGGGQRMCPGRHFAKQEIIGTFAVLFTHYEIELRVPKEEVPDCDMRFFPFGGLPPTKRIPFRIRRRKIM
ncbi:hypothetical protein MMC18_004385 [Xylographa bjoerkii]|nr:hypothetical protein [Xylographa bjoerkii]